MTTMYQSVDDHDDNPQDTAQGSTKKRLWVWILIAVLILASLAIFSHQRSAVNPETAVAIQAERASYRTALSEPEVDLRRARLRDFETTYPKSELLAAVRAQLAVLDAHETTAWAVLSDAMYDPRADRIAKLAAIQAYEQTWGASYLGGRDGDIRKLREELELEPIAIPDRELKGVQSPISKNVPDRVMVGGPRTTPPPAPVRPYTPPPKPQAADLIVQPKVIKNVEAKYPKRAEKRGITAEVELSVSIDDKGKVQMTDIINVRAERYQKDFIKAAQRAARRTRYSPKTVNGKPVPTQGIPKKYVFRIE